jgi:ABC-type microcin C transport system permease subunit YejE
VKSAPKKQSYTRLVWNQYRRDRVSIVGLIFVLALFIIALGAPFLAGSRPIAAVVDHELVFPAVAKKSRLVWDQADITQRGWTLYPPVRYGPTEINLSANLEPPRRRPLAWHR